MTSFNYFLLNTSSLTFAFCCEGCGYTANFSGIKKLRAKPRLTEIVSFLEPNFGISFSNTTLNWDPRLFKNTMWFCLFESTRPSMMKIKFPVEKGRLCVLEIEFTS